MRRAAAALVVVAAVTRIALGDPEQDFRDASRRASDGAIGEAIAAFEALGEARPVSAWTDDAWAEAARLAERAGDFDRARRDLERAIAIGGDPVLARRARGDLARLAAFAGGAGEWSRVAAEHDRLVTRIASGGDPQAALAELEALVRANPGYPRGAAARLALGRGWEEEAEVERGLDWLRDAVAVAPPAERDAARSMLVRTLIRHRELDEARGRLAEVGDRTTARVLEAELAIAERRAVVRWALFAVLAALVLAGAVVLRRDAGSWRAAGRALARPSSEAMFLAPIAAVVAVIALTGNPLVARGVVGIAIAGTAIAWLSGAMLRAARPIGRTRAALHALGAVIAVLAAAYLIVDRAGLIELVAETWRDGPARR